MEERARALIAEEMSLRDLRKAREQTQASVAAKLGINQENVSRIEQRSDLLLSTLSNYVGAMGGKLSLVAEFPDRPPTDRADRYRGPGRGEAGAELTQPPQSRRLAASSHRSLHAIRRPTRPPRPTAPGAPGRLYPLPVTVAATAAALDERLTRFGEARAALLDALRGLDQARFVRRPPDPAAEGDRRWSIREVLWHVADSDRCWREWAEAALRGEAVTRFRGVRRPAHLNLLPQLIESLAEQRAATLALFGSLGGDADLTTQHPTPSHARSILEMLEHLTGHDREHIEQIAALAALPPSEER